MEKHKLFYSFVVFLGVASFVSCFTAEFKKSKKEDVRWDGERNCYIPESEAFALGTAAVLCLGIAQIVGNIVMYQNHRTRHKTADGYKAADLTLPRVLLLLSWLLYLVMFEPLMHGGDKKRTKFELMNFTYGRVSFVVVVLLLSTATSMSRTQAYGEGWLQEECYLVKDGVFAASGCLVLLTLGALIVAATKTRGKKQVEQVGKAEDTIRRNQNQEPREQQDHIPPRKKSETVISLVEEANSITDISRI